MATTHRLKEVHMTSLGGVGSSYQMKGFFTLQQGVQVIKINFRGIAFGGHYGGHNVNVSISQKSHRRLKNDLGLDMEMIDDLLAEVQRRLLQGEMIVEFNKIKPPGMDPFRNVS